MKACGRGMFAALIVLLFAASPVSAQITTGNVTGTVKDAQGGVVPGATVVLISEARGTKTAPVTTNETGVYVVPNVTADTYTVEVTMDGFKTVRSARASRSAAATASRSRRSRSKSAARPKRSPSPPKPPLVQSQSARAIVRGLDRAGREPADQPRQLHEPHAIDAWRAGAAVPTQQRRAHRRRRARTTS